MRTPYPGNHEELISILTSLQDGNITVARAAECIDASIAGAFRPDWLPTDRSDSHTVQVASDKTEYVQVCLLAIMRQASALIADAAAEGFVVTIETVPREPLAMGNFDMVAHVREAR